MRACLLSACVTCRYSLLLCLHRSGRPPRALPVRCFYSSLIVFPIPTSPHLSSSQPGAICSILTSIFFNCYGQNICVTHMTFFHLDAESFFIKQFFFIETETMLARSKSAMKAPSFSHAAFIYGYKLICISRGDWF